MKPHESREPGGRPAGLDFVSEASGDSCALVRPEDCSSGWRRLFSPGTPLTHLGCLTQLSPLSRTGKAKETHTCSQKRLVNPSNLQRQSWLPKQLGIYFIISFVVAG